MARPRLPKSKAAVSGALLHDPKRYAARQGPRNTKPLGEPYPGMTAAQREVWRECQRSLPWLHSAHRVLLRLVCVLAARMEAEDTGPSVHRALAACLSKLGATPARDRARG